MKAGNDFENKLFKLMINSAYGKRKESLWKRINVRFVNYAKDFLKYTRKPTYITHKIFGKDYAAIHKIKPVLILNKPIYVAFTVLNLSKWKMYDFHYNFIKMNFDAELLFTDTDSLTYEMLSYWWDVLFNEKIIRNKMKRIQSKKHKLGTYEIDKKSLSCFDDKRYVLDNEIYSLAYFHKISVTTCKEIKKDCD